MKKLRVIKQEYCIGCRLCSIYSSLLKEGKVDLNSSFVKVVKNGKKFKILIDYGVDTDFEFLVKSCPRGCFDIVDTKEKDGA